MDIKNKCSIDKKKPFKNGELKLFYSFVISCGLHNLNLLLKKNLIDLN
jgi:hypothetical protein